LEGGCFACGKEASGQFVDRVLHWKADQSVQVPACGGAFTPHGAVDSSPTKSMIAQLAIDCLTGNVARSELRTFIGDLSKITNLGGTVRPGWERYVQDPSVATRLVVKPWDPNPNCRHCQDRD
jgi:sulfur-carrier protein adenylyltransferase/sulfurtransferase